MRVKIISVARDARDAMTASDARCTRRSRAHRASTLRARMRSALELDRVAEAITARHAGDRAAVEKERRRRLDAETHAFSDIARDCLARRIAVETGEEPGAVEADTFGVAEQTVAIEIRLILEQQVVVLPEAPL